MSWKQKQYLSSNPKAYGEGFKHGIQLSLNARKINFKALKPLKALISPNYLKSHLAGTRDGYRQGLWKHEKEKQENRLMELQMIGKTTDMSKER